MTIDYINSEKSRAHTYDVEVECPCPLIKQVYGYRSYDVEVRCHNRNIAAQLAKKAGYVVRSVNMTG